jgi:DNA modification methylase
VSHGKLILGDCLEELKKLDTDSLDSLVTDPPAGISFMGKEWDEDKGGRKQWINWMTQVMQECMRVMKPGAHGLVWAIPRTSHWTATALEDAGFEVRDVVTHIFGSGFPKSMDISKAIDKAAGAEREVIGKSNRHTSRAFGSGEGDADYGTFKGGVPDITAPSTPEAKQWQGWGTALKPASEHWILVRKPLEEKTVAGNVLKHGTGGINIDASRIGTEPRTYSLNGNIKNGNFGNGANQPASQRDHVTVSGRFPANLVLSHNDDCEETGTKKIKGITGGTKPHKKEAPITQHGGFKETANRPYFNHASADGTETVSAFECTPGCAVAELDEQSGVLKSGGFPNDGGMRTHNGVYGKPNLRKNGDIGPNSGGASRFFYCAKASKKDKGVDNTHPTVKSSTLMSYLIKMITPPNGLVLDPFMGSGSTGVSAIKEGFRFVGIEKDPQYFEIAKKRVFHALPEFKKEYHK